MTSFRISRLIRVVLVTVAIGVITVPLSVATEQQPTGDSLLIGCYNIHVCRGLDGRLDPTRIAKLLEVDGELPDFVGLQEVDCKTERTERTNQLAQLEKLTGMTGRFGKSIDFQGGQYGLGFLTAGKVLEYRHELMPEIVGRERRSYQLVHIESKSGLKFWVLNTHLGLDTQERSGQIRAILKAVDGFDGPVILLGDMNESPDGQLYATLKKRYEERPADQIDTTPNEQNTPDRYQLHQGQTFSSKEPKRQIDYIWLRRGDGFSISRTWVRNSQASDHLPLFSVIEQDGESDLDR